MTRLGPVLVSRLSCEGCAYRTPKYGWSDCEHPQIGGVMLDDFTRTPDWCPERTRADEQDDLSANYWRERYESAAHDHAAVVAELEQARDALSKVVALADVARAEMATMARVVECPRCHGRTYGRACGICNGKGKVIA